MDIEIRLLRSFVAMHEARSITRAAERMGCTQSAMSMRLKDLESALGAPLFARLPQGLEPLPRGAELYARAVAVLAAYDEMLSATGTAPRVERVRIGLPDDYALAWLGPALAALGPARVAVEVTCALSARLVASVAAQDLDLAVVTTHARPAGVLAEAHLPLDWVGQPGPGPVRLAAYPEGCVFRQAMREALEAAGRPWQVAVQAQGQAAIFSALRAGLAVTSFARGTVPPEFLALAAPAGLPALPAIPLYLIARDRLSPGARRLAAALTEAMRPG